MELDKICDLTDDCGDNSDEERPECSESIMENFDNIHKPFGDFTQDSPHANFKWKSWSGSSSNGKTGPPFDHSTFGPQGHYLFIQVS